MATIGVGELNGRSSGWRWWLTAVRCDGFADDVAPVGADDVGRAEISVSFSGEPLTIAFNPGYLTDGLGALHSERVTFASPPQQARAVLRRPGRRGPQERTLPGGGDYVYLLMPVRLLADRPDGQE